MRNLFINSIRNWFIIWLAQMVWLVPHFFHRHQSIFDREKQLTCLPVLEDFKLIILIKEYAYLRTFIVRYWLMLSLTGYASTSVGIYNKCLLYDKQNLKNTYSTISLNYWLFGFANTTGFKGFQSKQPSKFQEQGFK